MSATLVNIAIEEEESKTLSKGAETGEPGAGHGSTGRADRE